MRITEGHLSQHHQGRSGGRDSALFDVAQDHALALLHQHGVFDLEVALKGGTALRKFRAGNAGRFSTDLDFAVPAIAVMTLEEQIAEKLARYRRASLARDLYRPRVVRGAAIR